MQKNKLIATTIAIILTATILISIFPTATAQIQTRATKAYLSVAPHLVGVGQAMTVNMWVYPSPATLHFIFSEDISYKGMTVTFTRPDGSKDTFMPTSGSGGTAPGQSEFNGAIWFFYKPNQVGTWTVQFSMAQQTIGTGSETVYYAAATSQVVTFTVQSDAVLAGIINGYPFVPLPTGYWERPINSDNREWSKIGGNWLQTGYDAGVTRFNPYSTAPNSPHILWKRETSLGGIIGGDWGSFSYGAGGGTPTVTVDGKLFYNMPGGLFQCVDLRTGQLLYQQSGTITLAQHLRAASLAVNFVTGELIPVTQYEANAPVPYLWEITGTAWKRYNPQTGTLLQTISNPPVIPRTPYFFEGDTVVYCIQQEGWNTTIPNHLTQNNLIKWDLNKVTGNNWRTGIVYNVSLKQPDGWGTGEGARTSGMQIANGVGVIHAASEDTLYAYDLSTGKQLWTKNVGYIMENAIFCWNSKGALAEFDSVESKVHVYDVKTGNELWATQVGSYPWGSQVIVRGADYDRFYVDDYDGFYALDANTGKLVWSFYSGSSTETIFNTWAFYLNPAIADGKVYIGTSEHTPTQPRIRGNKLFCLDAVTGKQLWNVSSALNPAAIADGILVANCENDGLTYAFGKGKTTTTVSVSLSPIANGGSTVIQGTVMDQSPAQPNTPAVSDDSMTDWMNCLHMQNATLVNSAPSPSGVQVILTATDPSGANINIGTTTTDGYGTFFYDWTPPSTGLYKIQATFAGSNSYWSSTAQTAVSVKTAPSASPIVSESPTATAPAPSGGISDVTIYIAIAAVAVIVVVIAAATFILRRKTK